MKVAYCWLALRLTIALDAGAASFGWKNGPEPANIAEMSDLLRREPYDMELLISYGTSKGGSAGHLALAIRNPSSGDDSVYTANFYADRSARHAKGFYTDDLMIRVPKMEYLYKTTSSVAETASFGLDFGEVYKRSVVGIRVYGVAPGETTALANFFQRINDDYRNRARNTEYHDREVKYDYLRLNCAKTIGSAFRYGAGYEGLDVTSAKLFSGRRVVAAPNANIPTEMAMKLIKEWNARGYRMDAVLYKKYDGSTYFDSSEGGKVAFKDLPNRFPSVLSRDFSSEQGQYEDFDNLYAMYLMYNLARYSVRIDDTTLLLRIDKSKEPLSFAEAAERAEQSATADSNRYMQRQPFERSGTEIGHAGD